EFHAGERLGIRERRRLHDELREEEITLPVSRSETREARIGKDLETNARDSGERGLCRDDVPRQLAAAGRRAYGTVGSLLEGRGAAHAQVLRFEGNPPRAGPGVPGTREFGGAGAQ